MTTRIDAKFAALAAEGRKAFVSYIMAGDPDYDTSLEVLRGLPSAGVDIIELGLPFTDPMADGPTIQLAGQRALEAGMTLDRTLDLARAFREIDDTTPIVLMGYYNPIYSCGVDVFLAKAKDAGIDGLIVVDLPPEEDSELCIPAQDAGLNFIRLATPTTDDQAFTTRAAKHVRLRLLCIHHRHYRRGRSRSRRRWPRGRPDQVGHRPARDCRLRHQHAREIQSHRFSGRWRGCRLGHCRSARRRRQRGNGSEFRQNACGRCTRGLSHPRS